MPTEDLDLLEKQDIRLERPKLYQVVMFNDDFTPAEFVVGVLMSVFNKPMDAAITVMQQVHGQGRGICGVYTRDVAETKVKEVMDWAKVQQHPLRLEAQQQP